MNIEEDIKKQILNLTNSSLVWNSVHRLVRDSVWSSVHNSISGNFLQVREPLLNYSRLSPLRDTLNNHLFMLQHK